MRKFQIPRLKTKDYNKMIKSLQCLPEYKRIPAENKLDLIKAYEAIARKEMRWMGKKFNKGESLKNFCEQNGINTSTFYGYINRYEKDGLDGLIPHGWGQRKGIGEYDLFLPQIREIYQYGKLTPVAVFRKLRDYCVDLGLKYPSEYTVRRMIKRKKLSERTKRKKKGKKPEPTLRDYTPDYIKIVDKKAFNIAMYKYGLIILSRPK